MKTIITLFTSFLILLTANAVHFTVRGYHPGPSAAAEMIALKYIASKYKVPIIKPVWNCHLCRGTGEMIRGTTCKCITDQEKKLIKEQEKKTIKDQEKKIITDKSTKINKDSKKSMSKSNFCLQSSEKSVTYRFYK